MFSGVFRDPVTFYSATTSSIQDQPYIRDETGLDSVSPILDPADSTVSCVDVEFFRLIDDNEPVGFC